ncbi:3-demethoxyubiquinol 3-hydroxylase [Pectobacterium polonicum]|uniref:3-demethoxyubiquinol 3-hydroxylase n=1 Tax=Pectobacterium polonicum TaxID=2485124 RepID=UPI0010F8BA14|nr:3-demethoxyubiquinol 3-hydroxylase [Pectobacterium polonicum]TKY84358.1 2-octaprenyl-3-methyl-6-methoxy-1,4-benzoquinol hydroxylase [Pectobacterium polonicum]
MHYDAIVVGGGMVGAAAALGLAQQGFQVAVIEQDMPVPFDAASPPDLRISAIGYASVALLKALGVWPRVQQMRSAPYRRLETWEWANARVVFDAADIHLPELGFMVENRVLQRALWESLQEEEHCQCYCPATPHNLQRTDNGWCLQLADGRQLTASLVVGADGANSQVRQWAGIGISGWQYRQSCMLIGVETSQPQQDVTWQQFTPSGPRAFLPLFDQWGSLVWYDSPQRIRQLQAMPLTQLDKEIAAAFPERLGTVKAFSAGSFPLVRRHAQTYIKSGLVLLGDAAHTINPLAGQGVNLGYRDVEALLDVLINARNAGEEWASERILRRYQCRRMPDNLMMQSGMDLFYNAFSNALPPLSFARNMALMVAQRAGVLKQRALKYAIGV